jgi:outer membrane protein TolC
MAKQVVIALLTLYSVRAQDSAAVVRLTLRRAIAMALDNGKNPTIEMAREAERAADARYQLGRLARMPNLEVDSTGQNQTRNLSAQGFRFDTPGFTIPDSVGPFNTFDARVVLTQPVLDLSTIRRSRAAYATAAAAGADTSRTRDDVAAAVAHAYVRVLREQAHLNAADGAVARARATLASARNKHDAGTGPALDVTRAEYQVLREEQERAVAAGEREQAVLTLLDAMAIGFDMRVEFDDALPAPRRSGVTPGESVSTALHDRADLEAERRRAESLRLNSESVRLERLPTIAAYADAGVLGGVETHTIAVSLRIPVFDGGRRKQREAEAEALVRQQSARESQLQRAVELQVRQARVAMESATALVKSSESYAALARAESDQARRRHDAGVAGALDLIEAEARLAAAERNRVDALYRYAEARIDAAHAAGTAKDLTLE